MNRFLIYGMALLILCGCSSSKVKIEGRLIGVESSVIYLERVDGLNSTIVDSVTLSEEGDFRISFDGGGEDPQLYNIVSGGERLPLFLMGGDRVSVSSIGSVSSGYRVEGSEESETLRLFYQPFLKGVSSLDAIASEYASTELTEEERREMARKYSQEYQSVKQAQLRFIIEYQASMAAVYALYQRLPGDQYLFNGDNDIIYLRTVADALEPKYPNSTYLKSLRRSISQMEGNVNLKSKVASVNFPELEIPDMYGKKIKLSSLLGQVILLTFWSSELGNSNVLNAELKEVYEMYKDIGFEVYQVGIDSSKSLWISTVQEQRLPWISVSDLRGGASPALGSYNVTQLPANFLIDKSGTIVARDVKIEDLESHIKKLLLE